jgi:hypothetical protein
MQRIKACKLLTKHKFTQGGILALSLLRLDQTATPITKPPFTYATVLADGAYAYGLYLTVKTLGQSRRDLRWRLQEVVFKA